MSRRLVIVGLLLALPQAVYAQFPSQNISLPTFIIPASAVNGGGVITGQLLAPVTPVDCSAPQYSFQGDTDTGVGYVAANVVALCGAGNGNLLIGNAVARLGSAFSFGWSSATSALAAIDDTSVFREAAGHSFWRVGTAAQRASWANTYTSSTNYESFSVDWQTIANTALVASRTAATGTGRTMRVGAQGSSAVDNYSSVLFTATALPAIRFEPFASAAVTGNGSSAAGNFIQLGGASAATGSSTAQNYVAILPQISQSGTAGYTGLEIDVTESSAGSGTKLLFDAQIGNTSKFSVSSTGLQTTTQTTVGNAVQSLVSTATNDDPIETVSQGRVTTTDATLTTVQTITIPTDFTVTISCIVTARRTGGAAGAANDGAAYRVDVVMKNTAGTAAEIAAETTTPIGESQAGFNASAAPSGATELIQVTGVASNNMTWHSTCRTYQVNQ